MNLKQRFDDSYIPEPMSGCWIWNKSYNGNGYGQCNIHHLGIRTAHRAAWTIYNGTIPSGMSVLHKCDIPACVNPSHLFLGTQSDNMSDCVSKGRHAHANKTSCPSGHLYDEENTLIAKKKDGLVRRCRICYTASIKKYWNSQRLRRGEPNRQSVKEGSPNEDISQSDD